MLTVPQQPLATGHEPGRPWELAPLARFLSVSKKTLERAIKAGKLKSIRINRRVLVADGEARRVAEAGL